MTKPLILIGNKIILIRSFFPISSLIPSAGGFRSFLCPFQPPKCPRTNLAMAMENGGPVPFADTPTESTDEEPKRNRQRRNAVGTRSGFARTVAVETRTLNVIDNEGIRPPSPMRYCDVRN